MIYLNDKTNQWGHFFTSCSTFALQCLLLSRCVNVLDWSMPIVVSAHAQRRTVYISADGDRAITSWLASPHHTSFTHHPPYIALGLAALRNHGYNGGMGLRAPLPKQLANPPWRVGITKVCVFVCTVWVGGGEFKDMTVTPT